jgi:hypothetical protein
MRTRAPLSMEPISPELCLVDPVLARRARELLPSLETGPDDGFAPEAPAPARAGRHGRLTRLGGWALAASLLLNVGLLWPKSTGQTPVLAPAPPPAPAPAPKATKAARSPAKHPTAKRPVAKRPTPKRTGGVLAAKAEAKRRTRPAKPQVKRGRRVLSWRATPRADLYDLVLWRGHRRVADLWPTKAKVSVATVACGAGKRLAKGRYLWFAYPVVDRVSHRYGALAGWGAVEIDPKAEHCFGT